MLFVVYITIDNAERERDNKRDEKGHKWIYDCRTPDSYRGDRRSRSDFYRGIQWHSAVDAAQDPLVEFAPQAKIFDPTYVRRSAPSPDDQYFVQGEVRYARIDNATLNGVSTTNWIVYIIQGVGTDCRRPLVSTSSGGITSFVDAGESVGKSWPFKECYEPLPNS